MRSNGARMKHKATKTRSGPDKLTFGTSNIRKAVVNGAPRVWAEKYIFCAQNTDETATRL